MRGVDGIVGGEIVSKEPNSKPFIYWPVILPIWATWVAVDKCGVIMAFENKPLVMVAFGEWSCRGRKKDVVQYCSQSFRGWRKSAIKLKKP